MELTGCFSYFKVSRLTFELAVPHLLDQASQMNL